MTHPLMICGFQGAIQRASTGFAVFVGILIDYRRIWQVDGRKSPPSAGREARSYVLHTQQLFLLRVKFFLRNDTRIQQVFILFQFVSVAVVIYNRYAALVVLTIGNLLTHNLIDFICLFLCIETESYLAGSRRKVD